MSSRKRSESQEARRFAWILSALLTALSAFAWWRGHEGRAVGCLVAAALALVVALAVPRLWLRFFRWWMKFAEGLSWISTRLLLGLFYYLLITPTALFMRVVRRDALDLAWKDGRPSYWIDREPVEPSIDRYGKQY